MASSPISSWQIEGEKMDVVTDFLFLGSKVTVDGDWSHETRRWLLLVRKAMTNLDCVKKQRHHLADKGPYGQCYSHICESWTIKKAEYRRRDAFKLWYWRRLLRVPWTARRSNQSVLREISLEYSLEGLMLKLKLQYFGHLVRTAISLEKTLILAKIKGRRRKGCQRMR